MEKQDIMNQKYEGISFYFINRINFIRLTWKKIIKKEIRIIKNKASNKKANGRIKKWSISDSKIIKIKKNKIIKRMVRSRKKDVKLGMVKREIIKIKKIEIRINKV